MNRMFSICTRTFPGNDPLSITSDLYWWIGCTSNLILCGHEIRFENLPGILLTFLCLVSIAVPILQPIIRPSSHFSFRRHYSPTRNDDDDQKSFSSPLFFYLLDFIRFDLFKIINSMVQTSPTPFDVTLDTIFVIDR